MQRVGQDVHGKKEESGNWPRVLRPGRLPLLAFLVCAIPFLNGCAFWALSGGDPMGKAEAYQTIGRPPRQMTGNQRELATKLYSKARSKSGFPEKKGRVSATAVWKAVGTALFTLGLNLKFESVSVEKPGELENSLYTYDKGLIPGYPFLWPWWSEWVTIYSMEDGEELGGLTLHGLGLGSCLGGYACQVYPERKSKKLPPVPSSFGDKYNVKTAWHGLFGAFAKGRVNHRKYLQVFWIPIPLGPAED